MNILVAIVAFRNSNDVVQCFSALVQQDHHAFSICVCENGGIESHAALLEALQQTHGIAFEHESPNSRSGFLPSGKQHVRVICAPDNGGYAAGVNACLQSAVRPWDAVWVLNPDTEPEPGALSALIRRMQHKGHGIVGGVLISKPTGQVQLYGGRWRRFMARGYNIGRGADRSAVPDVESVEATMNYVNGACMLVSRTYVENVGAMQDDYFLYCEEVDWCLRRGNHSLGLAWDAIVLHGHGTTIGSSSQRRNRSALSVYLDERNKLALSRAHFASIYPLIVLTTLVLTTQYLAHGAIRNFGHALAGWWAGVRGEKGRPQWR